jgi:hypothetical protein
LMAVLAICCGIVSLAGKTTRFQSYAPSRESVAMPGRKQEPASFRSARGSFERNPRTDEPKH